MQQQNMSLVELFQAAPLSVRCVALGAFILAVGVLLWRELRVRRINADAAGKEAWNDKG